MHRTFNMGLGMVLAVSKSAAQSVESWISERLPGSQIIGIVNDEGNRVTHVNSEVVFEHY
jgi:phosphoribosylaminoimidazole (AIR) synthetase